MKTKKIITLIMMGALTIGTVGCANNSNNGATSGKHKDTIVYGISTSPSGVFNPLLADSKYDDAVDAVVYSSLLKLDKNQNVEPDLAESYKVSDDNLKITFKLKKDLKWSDGQKLTAKDVEFTLKSLAHKDYQGANYNFVKSIVGAEDYNAGKSKEIQGIKVVDESTIELTFVKAYAPALINIGTTGIIPEHIWKDVEPGKWKTAADKLKKPVGSGPYKLESFTEGSEVKFVKNDNYYAGKPKTEKLVYKVVNDDTVGAELKNGGVDIADVSNLKDSDRKELENNKFIMKKYANNLFQYMGTNLRNKTLQDKNIREAFIYALDRKSMVDKLLEGNGTLVNTPMLSSSWAYPKAEKLEKYDFNVKKAKELLEKSGYKDTNNDGYVDKDGKNLEFTLDVPTGNKLREQTAQIIQENLKQAGVKINLNTMEFKALMQKVVANHDFELYMMGNNLPADPDLTSYWSSQAVSDVKGKEGWNISGLKSPEVDKFLEEGIGTFDLEKRKAAYEKFGVYMNKELPWIYLYEQNIVKAFNPKLKGFEPSTLRDFSDAANWQIEE